ncbi:MULTISPECIES: hypothetical protein [Pseudomonas]|uniref:hypothetical protein n=1 Tax=Pseudomonas TaxID=286 RepID=UPI003260C657
MNNAHEVLLRKVEQLEQFRAEVQAICEDGNHRIKHTQLQMCGFLDGLRLKTMKATQDAPEEPTEPSIEAEARVIYESWSAQPGFRPWVDGGNSAMQDKARVEARRGLEVAG